MRHVQRLIIVDPNSGNNKRPLLRQGLIFLKNTKCFPVLYIWEAVPTLALVISKPYKKTVMFTKTNLFSASLFLIIAIAQMALS